jgi:hypothetical protein
VKLKPVMDAFERSPATIELAGRVPARGAALELAGLAGSSGAVLAAWVAREQSQRLVVVIAPHARRGGAVAHRPGAPHRWRRRALPPARGPGRGRAALRDRRRAGRNHRGAAPWPAPDSGHHRASHRGANSGASGPGRTAPPPRRGRAATADRGRRCADPDGIPPGRDGHRGRRVQRAGRHRGRVRIRDGGPRPTGVVGRRHLVHPRLRSHDPAVAGDAGGDHGVAGGGRADWRTGGRTDSRMVGRMETLPGIPTPVRLSARPPVRPSSTSSPPTPSSSKRPPAPTPTR